MARCYRDESGKPDRQPEFTQLDLEMAFTSREGVMDLVERLLGHALRGSAEPRWLERPFRKMGYQEAMRRFGVDKPDVRHGNEIQEVGDRDSEALLGAVKREPSSGVAKFIQFTLGAGDAVPTGKELKAAETNGRSMIPEDKRGQGRRGFRK